MYQNEQSPLAYLAAFAISFAAGALTVICAKAYAAHLEDATSDEPEVS